MVSWLHCHHTSALTNTEGPLWAVPNPGDTVGLPVSSPHNITPQLPKALEIKLGASA